MLDQKIFGLYKEHTCREVSPGLDAPRDRAERGEFGKLPATQGASNPGLTSLQVCRFYLMPLRLKCTEDFTLYSI